MVVNVNPLYTPRELEHQLKDSGARAIVVLENFAATLQQVMDTVPTKQVILASMGDMLGSLQRALVNHVVRKAKKLVPPFQLPDAVRFNDALALGRGRSCTAPAVGPDDIAVLQYTGGTTGVSKGAVLLHRNLVANLLQAEAWNQPALKKLPPGEQPTTVCALPLYHIFGFTANMMLSTAPRRLQHPDPEPARHRRGAEGAVEAPLPQLPGGQHDVQRHGPPPGLQHGRLEPPDAGGGRRHGGAAGHGPAVAGEDRLPDRRRLRPVARPALRPPATRWTARPTAATSACRCRAPNWRCWTMPGTRCRRAWPARSRIRGPQVMAGYWQRPDETAKVMTRDGFFRTGDIGMVDERGYFRIVDRKKDMILVSGFNVYPNEIEDLISTLPGVLECAAFGVPDAKAGEAVKLVVVKKDPSLSEADIRHFCEANLTGYKRPRSIEFRDELPKSAIGKILRRELREARESLRSAGAPPGGAAWRPAGSRRRASDRRALRHTQPMSVRLYVDAALQRDAEIDLPAAAARHVQVRRLQPADRLRLFDGRGGEWAATVLHMGRSQVRVRVDALRPGGARAGPARHRGAGHAGQRAHGPAGREGHRTGRARDPAAAVRALGAAPGRRPCRAQARALAGHCRRRGRTMRPHARARGGRGADAGRLSGAAAGAGTAPAAQPGRRRGRAARRWPPARRRCSRSAGRKAACRRAEENAALARGFVRAGLGERVLRAETAPLAVLAWAGLKEP